MKKILKLIAISIAVLVAGFGAMVLPFRLFDELSGIQMRILFIAETIVYFAIISAFFLIKESRGEKREKRQKMQERHNRRTEKRLRELDGIKIGGRDIAA